VVASDFKTRSGLPVYANEEFGKLHAGQATTNKLALQSIKLLSALGDTQKQILASSKRIEALTARVADATERTAAATERQNAIGMAQLSVAETQAAIAEKQLELANVQALEKRRQVELKQAAYALSETIDGLAGETPEVRLFYLYDQRFEVEAAQLVADHAEEIADKNYIRDTLKKLAAEIAACEAELSQKVHEDFKAYFDRKAVVQGLYNELNALSSELDGIAAGASINFGEIIRKVFNPPFASKISGKVRFVVLALYFLYGIFIAYGLLLFLAEFSQLKSAKAAVAAQRSALEAQIANVQGQIAGFEQFFADFSSQYNLP